MTSYAVSDKLGQKIADMTGKSDDLEKRLADMKDKSDDQARRLAVYENPHTPPSRNSLAWRKEKKDKARRHAEEGGTESGRPGGKKGHKGSSHARKADRIVKHRLDACPECGGRDLHDARRRPRTKMIHDVPSMPKIETTAHVSYYSECAGCGSMAAPELPGLSGTGVGPNLAAHFANLWAGGMGMRDIARISATYGSRMSAGAVQSAIYATAEETQPVSEQMRRELADAPCLCIDETPYTIRTTAEQKDGRTARRIRDKMGQIWAAVSRNAVVYRAVPSRSGAVLDNLFPFFEVPATTDGLALYSRFKTRQRCHAHVIRDVRHAAEDDGRPEAAALSEAFMSLLYDARKMRPDAGNAEAAKDMERRAMTIADRFGALGMSKTATYLGNAAPDLFTHVTHPGMHPTNNAAERALRVPVKHRFVRQRIHGKRGMLIMSTLLTCIQTWTLRKMDVQETLAAHLKRAAGL